MFHKQFDVKTKVANVPQTLKIYSNYAQIYNKMVQVREES